MKICVLMASFNGSNFIKEQIDSILSQKGVDVSLYVKDDFSTDGTLEILESYLSQKNFYLLCNDRHHGSAGKNFYSIIMSMDFDEFDYVAFSDQDDVWSCDKLKNSVEALSDSGGYAGVSSCVTAFWEDGRSVFIDKASYLRDFDYLFESAGPGCTYMITARLANEIKFLLLAKSWIYSSVFSHDWLIYAYARCTGYRWKILPYSTITYRQHNSNETGVNLGFRAACVRLAKIRSGWYLDQVYAVSEAVGCKDCLNSFFNGRGIPNLRFYLSIRKMRRKIGDALLLGIFFFFRLVR